MVSLFAPLAMRSNEPAGIADAAALDLRRQDHGYRDDHA